ncbi:MAG: hypothetical protein AAGJ83_14725, partial [Planctomycetota bacterium]
RGRDVSAAMDHQSFRKDVLLLLGGQFADRSSIDAGCKAQLRAVRFLPVGIGPRAENSWTTMINPIFEASSQDSSGYH